MSPIPNDIMGGVINKDGLSYLMLGSNKMEHGIVVNLDKISSAKDQIFAFIEQHVNLEQK